MDDKVKIRINGMEVEASPDKTLYQVAKELGIHIPVLCHFEPLIPKGACRICVVEDRGALKTACTTPVAPGMDIQTDSPKVMEARKMNLQLIFSERNHYCMYCERTGECELQNLGYEHGLDHFEFPTYERRFPVDNSHEYILFDHNRCVLCRRCVRACSDLAGHYVLSESERGIETMIIADLGFPLGESSCVSCGLCVQVCPTGALIDKRCAYLGREIQTEQIVMNCDECAVGCGINVFKKVNSNFIVKIYGDWNSDISGGLTCKQGRYSVLFENKERLCGIKVKDEYGFRRVTEERAIELLHTRVSDAIAYVDGFLYNEELEAIKEAFKGKVYSINKLSSPLPTNATLKDLSDASAFMVIGVDLNKEFGVVGSLVKKRVYGLGATLIVVDEGPNTLSDLTHHVYNWEELESAIKVAKEQNSIVIIYKNLCEESAKLLKELTNAKFLWLPAETNAYGLINMGIEHKEVQAKNVFIFTKDPENIKKLNLSGSFVVLFTPYFDNSASKADMLIAVRNSFERCGTFYNLENKIVNRKKVLEPLVEAIDIEDFIKNLFGATHKVK